MAPCRDRDTGHRALLRSEDELLPQCGFRALYPRNPQAARWRAPRGGEKTGTQGMAPREKHHHFDRLCLSLRTSQACRSWQPRLACRPIPARPRTPTSWRTPATKRPRASWSGASLSRRAPQAAARGLSFRCAKPVRHRGWGRHHPRSAHGRYRLVRQSDAVPGLVPELALRLAGGLGPYRPARAHGRDGHPACQTGVRALPPPGAAATPPSKPCRRGCAAVPPRRERRLAPCRGRASPGNARAAPRG